ncbi:unnamed protein product, partial [Prorocentrum cordatum]
MALAQRGGAGQVGLAALEGVAEFYLLIAAFVLVTVVATVVAACCCCLLRCASGTGWARLRAQPAHGVPLQELQLPRQPQGRPLGELAEFIRMGGEPALAEAARDLGVPRNVVQSWWDRAARRGPHAQHDDALAATSLGGWLRDLTEEGIEPHPGPLGGFMAEVRAMVDAHAADAEMVQPLPRPELRQIRRDLEERVQCLERFAQLRALVDAQAAVALEARWRDQPYETLPEIQRDLAERILSLEVALGEGPGPPTPVPVEDWPTPVADSEYASIADEQDARQRRRVLHELKELVPEEVQEAVLRGPQAVDHPRVTWARRLGSTQSAGSALQPYVQAEEALAVQAAIDLVNAVIDEQAGQLQDDRVAQRWRARGSEECVACSVKPPRDKWGYRACTAGSQVRLLSLLLFLQGGTHEPMGNQALVQSRTPAQLRQRIGIVFRDLLQKHVAAESAAARQATGWNVAEAVQASQLLWIAPALLLRHRRSARTDVFEADPEPAGTDAIGFHALVRQRLQAAEAGADKARPPAHRAVRRRLRLLRDAAQCGPGCWRNSYLKEVGAVARGIQALARWAQMWKQGRVRDVSVEVWTAACITPADCGWAAAEPPRAPERKLRPIACAEVLTKFVEGVCIDEIMTKLLQAFEPRQLGCGTRDGALLIIYLVRSWAKCVVAEAVQEEEGETEEDDPEVLASIDLENANGRAFRSSCLRGCRHRAPELAALAATQWRPGRTTVWQRAGGHWRESTSSRGGWQGTRLMQILFAMGLEAYDGADDAQLPLHLRRLAERIPRARGGIPLLGGAAQGDLAGRPCRPAQQGWASRPGGGELGVQGGFSAAHPGITSGHLFFFMLSKSVAHALSYDARLVPSPALGAVAEPVRDRMEHIVQDMIFGKRVEAAAVTQMRLAGAFGGMGLRREAAGSTADAAFWAAWAAMQARIPVFAAALGVWIDGCAGALDAGEALSRLGAAGVTVDLQGGVRFTPAAAAEYAGGPWSTDAPADALGALQLHAGASAPEVAPGAGAGALWIQMPSAPAEWFPSSFFRAASLRRLGAVGAPRGATCRIPRRGQDGTEVRGQPMDTILSHQQLCKQGPARMRPRRALSHALAQVLRACRAEVDIERVVPELVRVGDTGVVKEAVMDLAATFPRGVQPLYIDVAIRCPHAARYAQAATTPGQAAAAAVAEKRNRYGTDVMPVVFETYWIIAPETARSLELIAAHAGCCLRDALAAPRLVPKWRATLERIVQFAAADVDLLALGTDPIAAEVRRLSEKGTALPPPLIAPYEFASELSLFDTPAPRRRARRPAAAPLAAGAMAKLPAVRAEGADTAQWLSPDDIAEVARRRLLAEREKLLERKPLEAFRLQPRFIRPDFASLKYTILTGVAPGVFFCRYIMTCDALRRQAEPDAARVVDEMVELWQEGRRDHREGGGGQERGPS